MARPKADLPHATSIRALADSQGRISIRVSAGARQEFVAVEGNRLSVKVRVKPQNGAANAAVIGLLAKALGIAASSCRIVRGMTSRDKLIQID